MKRAIWVFWLLVVGSCFGETKIWRLGSVARPETSSFEGLQLVALTASQNAHDLILRVSVFNNTSRRISGSAPIRGDEIRLATAGVGPGWQGTPTTSTLTDIFGLGSLEPFSAHTSIFTFACGQSELSLDVYPSFVLHVRGFAPLDLRFSNEKLIHPIDWAQVSKRSPLHLEVAARAEALALLPMRLHSMSVKDDCLELTLSIRNAGRYAVTWTGTLNGTMSLLFTGSAERLSPCAISPSLAKGLAPEGKVWASGEDNLGWVRFPKPHPHDAHELAFLMPGYDVAVLKYEAKDKCWTATKRTLPQNPEQTKAESLLAEEQAFKEIRELYDGWARGMRRQESASVARLLSKTALEDHKITWPLWQKAPITSVQIHVPPNQRVSPDAQGRLQDLRLEMTYGLQSLPQENLFVSKLECDLRRNASGEWKIEFIDYNQGVPFWLMGYTQVQHSEHFVVIHRPGKDEESKAALARRQLEKAYNRLQDKQLQMKQRYAAFALSEKEDFEKITDIRADGYSGAASSAYEYRNGEIKVINQALYLNDYSFFQMQRAWGKQDRQVTIQHELAHLALGDLTRPWTPTWLVEGAAMHYAEQCDSFTRDVLRRSLTPDISLITLSRLPYFGADTKEATRMMVQYQLSGETVKWIVKRHGVETMLRLYAAYAQFIPASWHAAKNESSERKALLRQQVANDVLARQLGGLTLEQLDAQVRLGVLR